MTVVDGKSLQYFVAVCRYGSTRKAAGHLFITQQGLSRAIYRLERHFKLRLLKRSSTGIALTPAGELLFDESIRILAELECLEQKMRAFLPVEKQILRIGITAGLIGETEACLSLQALADYAATHSHVDFSYVERGDDDCVSLLREQKIDIACVGAIDPAEGYVCTPLSPSGSIVIVSTDNPLANKSEVGLADLSAQTIIAPPDNHSATRQFELWFKRCGRTARLLEVSTSLPTALSAVYLNRGVIIVPSNSVPQVDDRLARLIPIISADDYLWTVNFAYRADHPQRVLIEECVDYLRAQLGGNCA
ncbi:MAG: LysR family transcriptional regulator [Bifidobacteriaceae bacterium]|jgi:DNA-binding transcriptional LysR family regulator|nr:LysR family transcriptional regulator [Bifidobacteriaceae bacterium]